MKNLLFSLSLLATVGAFAVTSEIDAGAQIFGVLPVAVSAGETIIAVPWVSATNESASAISVTDIVKTDELENGDWIRVWNNDNNRFDAWKIQDGEWVDANVVTPTGMSAGNGASITELQRGAAIVLHKATAGTVYLNGQYLSTSAGSVTCAKASDSEGKLVKAYTLIAPPAATNTYVNNIQWENVGEGDYLTLAGVPQLEYKGGKWGQTWKKSFYEWTDPIPAGQGYWFTSVTTNGTSSVVVTW